MRRAKALCGAVMVMAAGCALHCRAEPTAPPAPPTPAFRIPVDPLGFLPPSAFYLDYRLSSVTLGFFDDDHLLFTFHEAGLMKRLPQDPADDEDQMIRALVVDARTGKVLKQAEWRMHDRNQFLWPFPGGKFLLRIRNTLYVTGPSLELEPYLTFSRPLRAVQVSPERKWLAVEVEEPVAPSSGPRLGDKPVSDDEEVRVLFFPAGSRQPVASSLLHEAGLLPLMGGGLLDVAEGQPLGQWRMREVPFHGTPQLVGNLRSWCRPSVQPLSESVALVSWCAQTQDDRPVFAVNLDGKELWEDRWQSKYVWPDYDFAEDGSRFAYESIELNTTVSAFTTLDAGEVAGQEAGVYDTQSGKLLLVRDASPVISAGQNIALSPDGRRFAILRHGAIEIYDLPPAGPAASAPAKK